MNIIMHCSITLSDFTVMQNFRPNVYTNVTFNYSESSNNQFRKIFLRFIE